MMINPAPALGDGWDVTVITDASRGTSVEAHQMPNPTGMRRGPSTLCRIPETVDVVALVDRLDYGMVEAPLLVRRTVWKRGFVASALLFADALGRLLATEEFATRVMAAGLRDVAFQDVTSEASVDRPVLRAMFRFPDSYQHNLIGDRR